MIAATGECGKASRVSKAKCGIGASDTGDRAEKAHPDRSTGSRSMRVAAGRVKGQTDVQILHRGKWPRAMQAACLCGLVVLRAPLRAVACCGASLQHRAVEPRHQHTAWATREQESRSVMRKAQAAWMASGRRGCVNRHPFTETNPGPARERAEPRCAHGLAPAFASGYWLSRALAPEPGIRVARRPSLALTLGFVGRHPDDWPCSGADLVTGSAVCVVPARLRRAAFLDRHGVPT